MNIVAESHTEEWYAARRTGIGASQAAAVVGMSPYKTPLDVYREVRGESTFAGNKHTRFGTFMEPSIVAMYADEIGQELTYPMPMCRHPEWEFMLATPDAQQSSTVGVEIKTIGYHKAAQVLSEGIDDACPEYVLQAQQQMAVMDWELVNIVMLIDKELHVFPVERDDEIIEDLAVAERDLWERIVSGDPPEPSKAGDLKIYLQRRTIVGSVVPLTSVATTAWEEYESIGKQIKELKDRRDLLKASVLHEIGDAPAGLLSDGDRMIRRKLTEREGYTVEPSEVLDVRAVKYDGSPIVVPAT